MGSADSNTEYKYYPDAHKTTVFKKVRINYLLKETIEGLIFLKNTKKLIYVPPPPKEIKGEMIPEGTYQEDPSTANISTEEMMRTEGGEDVAAQFETMGSMADYSAEYSSNVNKMDLYMKYSEYESRVDAELEKDFGDVFNAENMATAPSAIFDTFAKNMKYYDDAYNYSKYFVIEPLNRRKYEEDAFQKYFVELIKKHSNSQSDLDQIKAEFYKIIKPTYLYSKLCNYFKENVNVYNKKDDALIIINLGIRILRETKYADLKTKGNRVYCLKTDEMDMVNQVMDVDAIKLADIACVVYPIVVFIAYGVNEHFKLPFKYFYDHYKKHMAEKKIDSFYVFLMDNPPNISKLQ